MAYGICLPDKVMAKDVDSLNRSAVSAAAYENGFVGNLLTKSTTSGEEEVWVMTAPVTGALSNLWMVYDEDVVTTSEAYRGIDIDIRNRINAIGDIFSVFQPKVGDLITLDANALAGTKSTNDYVVATNTAQALTWAAAAVSGLTLKLVKDPNPIALAGGSIGSQRIATAYQFEVVAVS
jgi:hypothetical protein